MDALDVFHIEQMAMADLDIWLDVTFDHLRRYTGITLYPEVAGEYVANSRRDGSP